MHQIKVLTCGHGRGTCTRPRRWLSRDFEAFRLRVGSLLIKCVGKAGWGITAWASVRIPFPLRLYTDAECYKELEMKKRKPAGASEATSLHLVAVESDVFSRLMPIVAHCSHTQYDDQSARKPGWITIKTMGSAWVVEAKDPDTCSRLTVVQSSLDDALALLSVLLESEEAPWEADPWMKQQAGRNSKK